MRRNYSALLQQAIPRAVNTARLWYSTVFTANRELLLSCCYCKLLRCKYDYNTIAIAISTAILLLLQSTVVYCLLPRSKYPGPAIGKVSKLWTSLIYSRGKAHLYYQRLHERYGDVIRVGPNELSFRDVAAIQSLMGSNGLPKGSYWDYRSAIPALVALRDPVEHARRRRLWTQAFASTSLKEYEVIVAKRARQLVARLVNVTADASNDGAINIGKWLGYFATDLMGDMAFGGGFELVKDGEDVGGFWHLMESGIRASAVSSSTPWAVKIVNSLPWKNHAMARMRTFAATNVMKRIQLGATRKDLFYYLSGEHDKGTISVPLPVIVSDGTLAIVGGSDTTSTTLTALLHHLIDSPTVYKFLQEEIDAAFPNREEPLDALKLSQMEWLNSCINEALRLQPPIPDGSPRSVPRGAPAHAVGTHLIPEGTQVFVHTYSVQHDPRNFSSPDLFLPQRWLSSNSHASKYTDMPHIAVHNHAAFIPFSYGPANCAGKSLAMLEMRMLVTWLLQKFEFKRANTSISESDWESSLEDFYVLLKGPLWVQMTLRDVAG
ncbi:cytochrome P450 [Auriscalpium vulgare]|uniref:Cytochrome P450 n=1 Tax=Auriscalpium vulgare TaxID=40419 RepID=A0ACB8RHB1_9AGAM|nr:cytochrome P450 [Auriscalpium vulgare]